MGFGQWIKAGLAGSAIVGFGVINFIYNTPTDEELINVSRPFCYENHSQLFFIYLFLQIPAIQHKMTLTECIFFFFFNL